MAEKKRLPKKKATSKTTKKKPSSQKTKAKVAKKYIGSCFVMMPFKEPFNMYYNSIFIPAIRAAKLNPNRADDLFRPGVIVTDLWKMIQDAKVLLAELTTKNANVFYELGLAHAIGKPIVLVSETEDDIPFDLRQLRVLRYNKNDPSWGEKLMQEIIFALQETLESPIEAVPSIFRKKVKSQAPEESIVLDRIEALESEFRRFQTSIGTSSIEYPRSWVSMRQELKKALSPGELRQWIFRWTKEGYTLPHLERLYMIHGAKSPSMDNVFVEVTKFINKSTSELVDLL